MSDRLESKIILLKEYFLFYVNIKIVQFDQKIWGPTKKPHIAQLISQICFMFNFFNKRKYKIIRQKHDLIYI